MHTYIRTYIHSCIHTYIYIFRLAVRSDCSLISRLPRLIFALPLNSRCQFVTRKRGFAQRSGRRPSPVVTITNIGRNRFRFPRSHDTIYCHFVWNREKLKRSSIKKERSKRNIWFELGFPVFILRRGSLPIGKYINTIKKWSPLLYTPRRRNTVHPHHTSPTYHIKNSLLIETMRYLIV